jgi:hypothetical protein
MCVFVVCLQLYQNLDADCLFYRLTKYLTKLMVFILQVNTFIRYCYFFLPNNNFAPIKFREHTPLNL